MTVMSKPESNVDSSPQGSEYEARVLDVLKRAVAEALERKRKLGQYAVIWREGRVECIGPDAPWRPRGHWTPSRLRLWLALR
jgi:hypothetical protein